MQQNKFQNQIYNLVKKIPKGKISTYKIIAKLAKKPKAYRAAGNILGKNKNPKVPCHRVIRSDGKIGGYNKGVLIKKKLLAKEGIVIKNNRINLKRYKFKF